MKSEVEHKLVGASGTSGSFSKEIITGEFPIEVFPKEIQELIPKIAEAHSINPEPVGATMLPILSAAIGNTTRISPKPGWKEPIFVNHVNIGDSGTGKSPLEHRLLKPVDDLQSGKVLINQLQGESKNDAVKFKPFQHYLVSDITVEALAEIMRETPRGVLGYHEELAGFIKGHDQYRGKGNDRQKYLELWMCRPWKKDRCGDGSKYVLNTGCAILGGIQPEVVPAIFKLNTMGDGFLQRFTYSHVYEKPYSRLSVSEEEMQEWYKLVIHCYQIPLEIEADGTINHCIIELDDEAHQIFAEFHERYKYLSDIPNIKSFLSKLKSIAVRVTGILHVVNKREGKITSQSMCDGIRVADYFLKQIMMMLKLYGGQNALSEIDIVLIDTLKTLEPKVNNARLSVQEITRELNANFNGQCSQTEQQVGYRLKRFGLSTRESSGRSQLEWEPNKMSKLFLSYVKCL